MSVFKDLISQVQKPFIWRGPHSSCTFFRSSLQSAAFPLDSPSCVCCRRRSKSPRAMLSTRGCLCTCPGGILLISHKYTKQFRSLAAPVQSPNSQCVQRWCHHHRLDSLGGKSTFVTIVTTVTMSSVVMIFVSLCIWVILSPTHPADNLASAS